MQRKLIFLFIVIFLVANISAFCDKNQIDINSASAEELDQIYGIGSAKAQSIIEYRIENTFSSVDDLINVNGIGDITLQKIKEENLACVSDNSKENSDESVKSSEEDNYSSENLDENSSLSEDSEFVNKTEIKEPQKVERETIYLSNENPKDIKMKTDKQKSSKSNYSPILLLSFGLLIGVLYFIKEKRKNMKNEFR